MIAVWFSCGVASAVAAKITIDRFGDEAIILNNPVLEEDEDNLRFMRDVEKWLGRRIQTVINPKWPRASARDVWEKRSFMSGPTGAPCTIALKKEARQAWEKDNKADWHVLGFTADELKRFNRFRMTERSNVLAPLIYVGLTKSDCQRVIREAGIEPPRVYGLGYANANCIGCVKATSPKYWNLVRRTFPDVFDDRARQSRAIGCRLTRVKGERIFLDELPPDESEAVVEPDVDCGIFCEER